MYCQVNRFGTYSAPFQLPKLLILHSPDDRSRLQNPRLEFEARFASEEACRDYLSALRWPEGFRCPGCGHERAWPVRKVWFECARYGRQTSESGQQRASGQRTFSSIYRSPASRARQYGRSCGNAASRSTNSSRPASRRERVRSSAA